MLIYIFLIVALICGGVYLFLRLPKFGQPATGARLTRIQQSLNYQNGKFQNQTPTPDLAPGVSYFTVTKEFFFNKSKYSLPPAPLPNQKTDLLNLDTAQNILVWFGHSSYFMQLDGKKILVDPVFSGSASPVKFTTRSYPGSDVYTPADIPPIDYLFISHDHWDHLDYETIIALKPKIRRVITGLGTGAHLEHWGYSPDIILEKDWFEATELDPGFKITATPARHFSGRGLKRNGTLWLSFVLQTPSQKIYLGGDSGYDAHFAAIGAAYGPFDLAILECGQYHEYWHYIHLLPEEVIKAAQDLKARQLLPVHWGKFSLALHAWNEPVTLLNELAREQNRPLLTPMIGEAVDLTNSYRSMAWWEKIV